MENFRFRIYSDPKASTKLTYANDFFVALVSVKM